MERAMCASEFIHTILTRNLFRCMDIQPKFPTMMQLYTREKLFASELSK